MEPPHFDLRAALPALRDAGRYGELADQIERAIWTGSAHQDLSAARDALLLLCRLTKEAGFDERFEEQERPTMAGALLSHAIVLYARATEIRPIKGERSVWFGRSKLSGDQRSLHVDALDLRDKVVAHFGRGDHLSDGPYVRETLILRPAEAGAFLTFYSSRTQNRGRFAAAFLLLVEHVLELAYQATQARYQAIGRFVLEAAAHCDRELALILSRFTFDPAGYSMEPEWQRQVENEGGVGAWSFHGTTLRSDKVQ